MGAYLFSHFIGNQNTADEEQVYFSVSKDGTNWHTLNGIKPVLRSTVGDRGVRDPHILRKHDNSGFYITATDLSVYNRDLSKREDCWKICKTEGSRSIIVWESEDLIHWSEPWAIEVAPDTAGCAWAPETAYDEGRNMYMLFWASSVCEDNFDRHRIFRTFTRDFKSFTKTEVYMDRNASVIDTSILKEGDTYYRFTKIESSGIVNMEYGKTLEDKDFKPVGTYTLDGIDGLEVRPYEGPTAYKVNAVEKWCLLLDKCGEDAGYRPYVTEDITRGEFVSGGEFKFDVNFRHGTVMPITDEEYDRLIKFYD